MPPRCLLRTARFPVREGHQPIHVTGSERRPPYNDAFTPAPEAKLPGSTGPDTGVPGWQGLRFYRMPRRSHDQGGSRLRHPLRVATHVWSKPRRTNLRRRESWIDADHAGVAIENGVVHLSGQVDSMHGVLALRRI